MKDFRKGGITVGLVGGGFEGEETITPLSKLKQMLNLTDMKKQIPHTDALPGDFDYDLKNKES